MFEYKPNTQNTKANIINNKIEYFKYEKNNGKPTPKLVTKFTYINYLLYLRRITGLIESSMNYQRLTNQLFYHNINIFQIFDFNLLFLSIFLWLVDVLYIL